MMHPWHWQTWQGLPYLTCSLLQPWPHGFFTQQFLGRSPKDLGEILHPDAAIYRAKQVHGNTVLTTEEVLQWLETPDPDTNAPALPEADGLVTQQPQQSVWVCSADCTPVLIGDQSTGQVVAIHSGWRGTAAKIVPQAIAQLQDQGSQMGDLRIALGPAIAGQVYQVSTAVALEVGATIFPGSGLEPEAMLEQIQKLPDSPVLPDPELGRARLDVRRVIALQLEHLGVAPEQVAIAPHCTYQQPDLFFSYRRTGQKQVQWSGIVSTTPKPDKRGNHPVMLSS